MNKAAIIITGNFYYDVRWVEVLKELRLINLKEEVIILSVYFGLTALLHFICVMFQRL